MRDTVEAGAAGADDEHALVLSDKRADRVHNRLRAAGAGKGFHDERVAGRDLRDDVLLLGVRVKQKDVGGRWPGILAERDDRVVRGLDGAPGAGVATDRVEQRMVQVGRIGGESAADVGEHGGHEARYHVEPGQVRGEAAQPVDHGLRFEGAVGDGQRHERIRIQNDLELVLQRAGQFRVEERLALELEFEIAAVAANGEGAQQHGSAVVHIVVAPLGEADGQVHRFDAAHGAQFDALLGDLAGRQPRVAQGQLVADQVGEQSRLAGDELGQTARMGGAQFDPRAGSVAEVQQRGTPAHFGEFVAPALPDRVGHIAHGEGRIAQADRVRSRGIVRVGGRSILNLRQDAVVI